MAIGVIQLKFAAILLGPAGVGLIGAFQSITQLVNQISGLGLSKSGVREVAAAVNSDSQNNVGSTIYVLNRMCWFTGIIGTVFLILLALPISQITFGDDEHRTGLITLSCMVIITSVAQGKLAIIQGLRRIKDLVKVQMFGSLLGTLCSIPMYIFWGMEGIVPSLLLIALSNLLFAWWYSKKATYEYVILDWKDVVVKTRRMLGLGAAFMIGGLAATLSVYITRSLIIRDLGMDALGIHQAAFAISGYSLNFVLGAMGADFYPRLAGVSNDNYEMCKLVNEQTVIGLLLATPVLIAILGFAGWIVNILYSIEFYPATELLRWFVLGCYMRVISWPMGYVQIAKGAKYWFLFSQISFNIIQ
jgi:PST family polysaccharide transporter